MEDTKCIVPVPPPEFARFLRNRPSYYTFKIESFSLLTELLSKTGEDFYDSCEFAISGYNWKLRLYPVGDKKRNGSGHISLYLVLSGTNKLPIDFEVAIFFKLFAYDQIRDKYLFVEDASKNVTRFNAMKNVYGFSQFMSLENFCNASNGYLVDDCCVFGVEIFLSKPTGNGECVSIKKPPNGTFSYKFENFSKLGDEYYSSTPFNVAGHNWCITIYPNGYDYCKGTHLSLFIGLKVTASHLFNGLKVFAKYKLRVKDQALAQHSEKTGTSVFDFWSNSLGFYEMISLSDLNCEADRFIVNDTLIVEVEFLSASIVTKFK